jgi:hypothetical protein
VSGPFGFFGRFHWVDHSSSFLLPTHKLISFLYPYVDLYQIPNFLLSHAPVVLCLVWLTLDPEYLDRTWIWILCISYQITCQAKSLLGPLIT